MSLALDIADILEDEGVGTKGTDIFVGAEPDQNITMIACYDSSGLPNDYMTVLYRPTATVRIIGRMGDYITAHALARSVVTELNNWVGTINTRRYLGIYVDGFINFLGYDENRKPAFSLNFFSIQNP